MRTRKLETYNNEIREAYLSGAPLEKIAKAHGVSLGTIRNILVRLDVPLRKPGRPKETPKHVD